jgi:NMD protein affecting ribosome stability and mRNA decay
MFIKCVECDHILEDGEYLYKGKSYCDDCYRAVKKLEEVQQEMEHNLSAKSNYDYSRKL